MWQRLRGRMHTVATGIAIVSPSGERQITEVADVQLSSLTDTEIRAYISSGRPMDKAGAYAIQDEDVPTVAVLDGCYCSVMGLPLWTLKELLESAGVPCRRAVGAIRALCVMPVAPPETGH